MIVLSALLIVGSATAESTDAQKCEADKVRRTGSHASCQMKAQSTFVKYGDAARLASALAKCDAKFTDKFSKAEARWGAECPTTGDVGTIQTQVTADTDDLGVLLSGGTLPPVCGNGTIEAGEDCDFGNHAGETCDSQTASGSPYGALVCTPGSCTFETSGCVPRFEDTGLTVIDHQTGLEWEKKTGTLGASSSCPGGTNCGDPNDVNNRYRWSSGATLYDGSIHTSFLDVLNDVAGGGTSCFAGRCDWRIPSVAMPDEYGVVDEGEWESIIDCGDGAPCIDPAFGPTASDYYWSSSANALGQFGTWTAYFLNGFIGVSGKTEFHHARAVRGGS
jgi:hypothetical protein